MKNFCAICKSKRKCSKHLLLQTQIVHVCLVVVRLLSPPYLTGIVRISRARPAPTPRTLALHLPLARIRPVPPPARRLVVVRLLSPSHIHVKYLHPSNRANPAAAIQQASPGYPPPYSLPLGRYGLSNQPQLAINQLPLAIQPTPAVYPTDPLSVIQPTSSWTAVSTTLISYVL